VTDWSALKHAYGSATDIPAILAALTPDPRSEAWDELWGRICHQGTVYSASYAALPYLRELVAKWPPGDRAMPLSLAAAIVLPEAVDSSASRSIIEECAEVLPELRGLALEALAATDGAVNFVYVLQSALAFEHDAFWGRRLQRLVDGEFEGTCPVCDAYLYVAIGKYGFFVTAEEWVNRPATIRVPIQPASSDDLPDPGPWLLGQATSAGHEDVVSWIRHLFGTTTCPACSAGISVCKAILAMEA
jgi:hypothetical protein